MSAPPLRIGAAVVDLDRGLVRASDGTETTLRPKTTRALAVLAAARGEVVTKDALFEAVWPGVFVTEDNLVQCVGEIRRALGRDATALRTLPKRGYVLEREAEAGAGDGDRGHGAFSRARPRRRRP